MLPAIRQLCYYVAMIYKEENTGYILADSERDPLEKADRTITEEALSSYILSASGWRHVFAESGDEEDATERISSADAAITAVIAKAYYTYLRKKGARILLATDARPTGRVLADITLRILVSEGASVSYISMASAPEAMAYSNDGFDSFCYISASHNPIGHNGFKFGRSGGVFSKEEAEELKGLLFSLIPKAGEVIAEAERKFSMAEYTHVLDSLKSEKEKALSYYRAFVLRTAGKDEHFHAECGIAADINGSARALSIDREFLTSIGCEYRAINDQAGRVAHAIVPEGENLIPCRDFLEKCYSEDKHFIIGYTPDNDGDRGNFTYIDRSGKGEILQAQEVFALIVAIELADLSKKGVGNLAVAVNGPTSERIDAIAACFGAKVFRAEVGEANVVNLAAALREQGYTVHVLGEGSNGGNITEPAKVRDPLNSIMTILKLFSDKELYSYLITALGHKAEGEVSIQGVIDALPVYTTTGAFSSQAKLKVRHTDYRAMKKEYENLFTAEFKSKDLGRYGITCYEIHQTEGTSEKIGIGEEYRSGECKGGLKAVFTDKDGGHLAYIWMRPSGTEPVLRLLADVRGDEKALHDELLTWQRSLIERADASLD